MEKNAGSLIILFSALFLLVGALGGYVIGPEKIETVTEEKIVEVEVPVEYETIVYENITTNDISVYLDQAIEDFLDEWDDDERVLFCDGNEYDEDDIEISKIYDKWFYSFLDEDDNKYEVAFKVKLRYKEEDSRSCTNKYPILVEYEDGEDPVISLNN